MIITGLHKFYFGFFIYYLFSMAFKNALQFRMFDFGFIYNFISMKSDLNELIELYEAEKESIENCIKSNLEEGEYLNAHFHSQALFKVDHHLRMLYKMKDPFYDEKNETERMLSMYERFDNRGIASNLDSYYKKMTDEYKAKLQELNEESKKPLFDDQKIDDALFGLWAGIYRGFVLYLNRKDNLSITFESTDDELLDISISVKSALNVDYFFGDDDEEDNPLNKFKGLGFKLNNAGNKLIYKYDMRNFRDAIAIKVLLSRVIYDVFTYAGLDNPASLVYF